MTTCWLLILLDSANRCDEKRIDKSQLTVPRLWELREGVNAAAEPTSTTEIAAVNFMVSVRVDEMERWNSNVTARASEGVDVDVEAEDRTRHKEIEEERVVTVGASHAGAVD